jgi:hypothetical protein
MALRSNSLVAGDDCTFKNLKQFSETTSFGWRCRSQLLSNTPLIWVGSMFESFFENSRRGDDEL